MLVKDAPPIIFFSLDKAITQEEQDFIDKVENTEGATPEDIKIKDDLKNKKKHASDSFQWFPLVIHENIVPLIQMGISSSVTKKVALVDKFPQVKDVSNTVTIKISSDDSLFSNLLVNIADQMFALKDSLPRIKVFSRHCIVLAGRLVGFTHNVDSNSSEARITLTIQRGTVEEDVLRPEKKVKLKEATKVTDKYHVGETVTGG
jgi:hypothetical protein